MMRIVHGGAGDQVWIGIIRGNKSKNRKEGMSMAGLPPGQIDRVDTSKPAPTTKPVDGKTHPPLKGK